MALDPSISLGVKSYAPPPTSLSDYALNGMKMASMAQQISASKSEQANTEAALPSIQAKADTDQRQNDFVTKWLPANKDAFTDADGNVNMLKLTQKASADGMGDAALSIGAHDIANAGAIIGNAKTQQEAQIAKATYMNTTAGHMANIVADPALSDDEASALIKKAATYANSVVPGSGDQAAQLLTKQVPQVDKDGNQIFKATDQGPTPVINTTIDRTAAKEVARATQDLSTQFQNAQAKQRQDAALEISSQTPEGHATTGPQVNAIYQALRGAGIGPDKVPNGMSIFDMKQAYGSQYGDIIGKAVLNNQVQPSTREVYQAEAFKAKKDIAIIDTALEQATKMPKDMLGTRPGAIVGGLFNKWATANPQFAGMVTAVQTHNALYPSDPIDPGSMSVAQILEKLGVDKSNRTKDFGINSEAAGMQTLPSNGAPAAGQPTQNVPSPSRQVAQAGGQTITQAHVRDFAKKNNIPETEVLKMMEAKGIKVTQ